MKRGIFFMVSMLFSVLVCRAQLFQQSLFPFSLRQTAYSSKQVDAFSGMANLAALAALKQPTIGVYGERRYLLPELGYYCMMAGIASGSGSFGLRATYFGFSAYNETQVGLVYARKLGTCLDAGVELNNSGVRVPGYGKASHWGAQLAVLIHLGEYWHSGFQVSNPVQTRFKERMPISCSFGLGFEPSDKVLISTEVNKTENEPLAINAGILYKIFQGIYARAGMVSTIPATWLGLGYTWSSIRFDFNMGYDFELGFSPGLSVLFLLPKKAKQ